MIEQFQIADWLLCGLTVVMAVLGLFRGFSGTLAFLLATFSAALAGNFGWLYTVNFTEVLWQRALATLVGTLLIFGIVRLFVKKLVNGLLSQPSDAIFGFLTGAAFGALLLAAWVWSGLYLEYSYLAGGLAAYVG